MFHAGRVRPLFAAILLAEIVHGVGETFISGAWWVLCRESMNATKCNQDLEPNS